MSTWLHLTALFTLNYAGLCALSVTMQRHYSELHGRGREAPPALRIRLQAAGWGALALAFTAALLDGGAHGPLLWLGGLTAAATLLMLLLSFAPHHAVRLAKALGAVGFVAFVLAGVY